MNMDILKPPTDNLYKFMAISGLLVFILSFFPFYQLESLERDNIELAGQIKISGEKIRHAEEDMAILRADANDLKRDIENKKIAQATGAINEIEKKLSELKTKMYESRNKGRELLLLNIEQQTKNEIIIDRLKSIKNYRYLYFLMSGIGLLLMASGFGQWYFKLQKYQDILIKKQAEAEGAKKGNK